MIPMYFFQNNNARGELLQSNHISGNFVRLYYKCRFNEFFEISIYNLLEQMLFLLLKNFFYKTSMVEFIELWSYMLLLWSKLRKDFQGPFQAL